MRRKWAIALILSMTVTAVSAIEAKMDVFAEEPDVGVTDFEDSFSAAIVELYDASMDTTDEEVLETAENMDSDFSVLADQAGEDAADLIGALKSFEVEKGRYFSGGGIPSAYNKEITAELELQKDYMADYVVDIDAVTEVIPKAAVISYIRKGNTAYIDAQDWITAAYTGEDGTTNASAYGYTFTLTAEKTEDGAWFVTGISGTDCNFDWLTDAGEQDEYLAEAGVDISEGEEELLSGDLEAASLEAYYSANYTYDAEKAARYADKWWNSANSAYPSYVSRGVDCANFVSQCLEAGGMQRSGTWKPGTYAWVNVNGQIAYFKKFGTYTKATNSSVMKGSPVYYDWNNNGAYDHAVICVGKNNSGTPIIDSHTSARYHVAFRYRSASSIMTIQLHGSNTAEKKATPKNGWVKEKDSWYYYANDAKKTGWVTVGGEYYYLNSNGVMQTGWQNIDGKHYYLDKNGARKAGWQQVDGKWYRLDSSGAMLTGWQKIDGSWYRLDESGVMVTGWQKIGGKWFYLNDQGRMQTGWRKIGGSWYYLNGSGVMQTGWQKISGRWYYLSSGGVMQAGWQKIGGRWYYLNKSGIMQTGWMKVDGKWYYLNKNGVMQTGWQKIRGSWYYFYTGGAMAVDA